MLAPDLREKIGIGDVEVVRAISRSRLFSSARGRRIDGKINLAIFISESMAASCPVRLRNSCECRRSMWGSGAQSNSLQMKRCTEGWKRGCCAEGAGAVLVQKSAVGIIPTNMAEARYCRSALCTREIRRLLLCKSYLHQSFLTNRFLHIVLAPIVFVYGSCEKTALPKSGGRIRPRPNF